MHDLSFVVTITVTCYSCAPSSGGHIFTCGAIYLPPHAGSYWYGSTTFGRPSSSLSFYGTSHSQQNLPLLCIMGY